MKSIVSNNTCGVVICELPGFRGCASRRRGSGKRHRRLERGESLAKTVFLKAGSLVLSNSSTPDIPKNIDLVTCIHETWLSFSENSIIE